MHQKSTFFMVNFTNITDPCTTGVLENFDLGLHILALFVLFLVSALGVVIPIILEKIKNNTLQRILFIMKFFGSGVILSTAIVHIFPEAVESLSDECLNGWFIEYPIAGLFSLSALLEMHLLEWFATYIFRDNSHNSFEETLDTSTSLKNTYQDHNKESHSLLLSLEQKQHNLSTYSLEIGILVHSVVIGVSLGVATDEFRALFIALSLHQFFEGVGLGSMISKVNFKSYSVAYFNGLLYAITTPVGVAIGIGIHMGPTSPTNSLIATGIFESFAAGLLIYATVVHLIARAFVSDQFFEKLFWEKTACFIAFYIGAGIMAALAFWA